MWACLAELLNALVSVNGVNLPDKRVDSGCWLSMRSGFKSPLRKLVFIKPLSRSYQLWTLHCSDIICALLGLRANRLYLFLMCFTVTSMVARCHGT